MVENVVLKNLTTGVVLELDVVTTPYYILDTALWGEVEATHHSYKYVNQIGVYVTGTSLGTREIEITGWVIARSETQMTSRKATLNKFVNPQQMIEMSYSKYTLKFLPNRSIKYGITMVENNEVICKFQIVGMAADPLFIEKQENRVQAAIIKPAFHFPLIINSANQTPPTILFGVRESNLIMSVYNTGSVETGMRIVFKARGSVEGPSLIDVYTQEFFKLNKTITGGEQVEINTEIGKKTIIGTQNGIESNYFRYMDFDSTWLQLKVGDNLFRYNADVGLDNLEVYIYYTNKYLEVQECY